MFALQYLHKMTIIQIKVIQPNLYLKSNLGLVQPVAHVVMGWTNYFLVYQNNGSARPGA